MIKMKPQVPAAEAPKPVAKAKTVTPGVAKEPWQMTREEYASHIDNISYSSPEWEAIRKWNNEQTDLVRIGKRKPPSIGTKLIDAYREEVLLPKALSEGKPVPPEVLADYGD